VTSPPQDKLDIQNERSSQRYSTSSYCINLIMVSLMKSVVGVVAAIASLAGAAPQPIGPRQNGFTIQNWANDYADVDFNNLAGGAFNVTWDNNPGGNFVVGKGYRPGGDM
jgi:hypothetical protein